MFCIPDCPRGSSLFRDSLAENQNTMRREGEPTMKLREIAEKLVCKLEGDASIEIRGVAGIEDAGPGDLTFLANRKYRPVLETSSAASAILVARRRRPRAASRRCAPRIPTPGLRPRDRTLSSRAGISAAGGAPHLP